MNRTCFLLLLLGTIGTAVGQNAGASSQTGVLIMAHGGAASWNVGVLDIARQVDRSFPAEVAFGMATRANLQAAVDKLTARGVREIIAVPLFISSHSSIITSTQYLFGLRTEMPEDLKLFARMDHGGAGAGEHNHDAAAEDGTRPVKSPVPIRMTAALDSHPIVSDILINRANSLGRQPSEEVVIVVAHGPTPESDNQKWLADLHVLADRMKAKTTFHRIDYLTVRDDAPEPIRTKAAEEFRGLVQRAAAEGKRALVVPLLLSYGGIEAGLRRRLEGLEFALASQALLPDVRLVDWVLESVHTAR
jgi:hypothetical protein